MRKSINESGADAIELASRRRRGGHDSADAPQRFGLCTGARIECRLDSRKRTRCARATLKVASDARQQRELGADPR